MTHAASFAELIELADQTLAMNRRVRARSNELRNNLTNALLTYRPHSFPQLTGASDTGTEDRVRRLLRDFVSRVEPAKSFAGFSRGGMCQACGNVIKYGAIEFDVVVGTSEICVDADCHKVFLEESRAVALNDPS